MFIRKNSQNVGVNWAKKAYQWKLYTLVKSLITSSLQLSLLLSSTNILKTTQVNVFPPLRYCHRSFA